MKNLLRSGFAGIRTPRAFLLTLCLTTIGLYSLAGGSRLYRYGDLSAFIGFGCLDSETICFARDNSRVIPEGALVFRTGGYDGQFYYYLAAEIFTAVVPGFYVREASADGSDARYHARLDASEFRRARIGYPLLVAATAFGGPRALIAGMVLVPVLVHLIAIALLLRRSRDALEDPDPIMRRRVWPGLIIFALNPVSLFCFLYGLADGLALDLMVIAFLFLTRSFDRHDSMRNSASFFRNYLLFGGGALVLAFALLTREHALAGVIGLGFAGLTSAMFASDHNQRGGSAASPVALVAPAVFAILVLIGWWMWIGFSPREAAARGGLPLSGLVQYLSGQPDAFFSGRSYLVGLLIVYGIIFAGLASNIFRALFSGVSMGDPAGERQDSDSGNWNAFVWPAIACGALAANLALVSFATADEYWGNFANILRLFTPGFGALACVSIGTGVGLSGIAGSRVFRDRLEQSRILQFGMWSAVVLTGALVFAILKSEIAGRLLPVFEFHVGGLGF